MFGAHSSDGPSLLATLVISVVVLGLLLLRNRAPRRLRPELLWISPLIIVAAAASYFFYVYRPGDAVAFGALAAAAAVGVALGWWRGKLTRIEVHPESHDLSMQVSPLGVVLIILVYVARRVAYAYTDQHQAAQITGLLIALAVATVVTARVEMWLRARKLLAAAKAG